jgi:hypothetical protein
VGGSIKTGIPSSGKFSSVSCSDLFLYKKERTYFFFVRLEDETQKGLPFIGLVREKFILIKVGLKTVTEVQEYSV